MSFLSSMHQYVTSGISSLGLGNRRFSLSRQESNDQDKNNAGAIGGTVGQTGNIGSSGSIPAGSMGMFNAPSPITGSTLSSYGASATNLNALAGGVVIGNPNASYPLLGKLVFFLNFFFFNKV